MPIPTTLTKYRANILISDQNIETVQWRIRERVLAAVVETSDLGPEFMEGFTRAVLIRCDNNPERELQVVPRKGGRFLVKDAAFGRPIVEFTPDLGAD